MKNNQLPTIKTLWIGDSLGDIERLSLRSFLANGHNVEIFLYRELDGVPEDTVIRDANKIIPESQKFIIKGTTSYAGFADWFRYEMLYKEGGVWVDLDVICLKPFDFYSSLFFGEEEFQRYNNAVLGGEPNSPIFRFLANQASYPNTIFPFDSFKVKKKKLRRRFFQGNDRSNIGWGEVGPSGLTKAVNYFGLTENSQIHPVKAFYPIHYRSWHTIFDDSYSDTNLHFPDTYAIHLWNEFIRRHNAFSGVCTLNPKSLMFDLFRRYAK